MSRNLRIRALRETRMSTGLPTCLTRLETGIAGECADVQYLYVMGQRTALENLGAC